eukprot:gene7287-8101_t
MTPLSALYRSSYPRYPAFPSIYESKYAHDFKYTFWPVERCKREYPPPQDYSKFKFARSHYTEEFHPKGPVNNKMATPVSRHRLNNPHPRIHVVQDYPDAKEYANGNDLWNRNLIDGTRGKQMDETNTEKLHNDKECRTSKNKQPNNG